MNQYVAVCMCVSGAMGGFEGPLNWHLVHSGNQGNKGVEGKRGETAAGGDGGRSETKDKEEMALSEEWTRVICMRA